MANQNGQPGYNFSIFPLWYHEKEKVINSGWEVRPGGKVVQFGMHCFWLITIHKYMEMSFRLLSCTLILQKYLWNMQAMVKTLWNLHHIKSTKFIWLSWPSDYIFTQSGSTFSQGTARCLMVLSHYLNQCWSFIKCSAQGICIKVLLGPLPSASKISWNWHSFPFASHHGSIW